MILNFLAHAYLSGNNQELIAGNISGDFTKNKDFPYLSLEFRKGVLLHRFIDEYTDAHPKVKEVQQYFIVHYRHYSRVISDIIFDYFLAKNWARYSPFSLQSFSKFVYESIENNYSKLPERFKNIYPYMKNEDWLFSYQSTNRVAKILKRMQSRAQYFPNTDEAISILIEHEAILQSLFFTFFDELKLACKNFVQDLSASLNNS